MLAGFPDLEGAAAAAVRLAQAGASAVELLDRSFIEIAASTGDPLPMDLPQNLEAVLIVEVEANSEPAAVASLEAAQRLNPGIGYGSLGLSYYLAGRYADAIAMLDRGLPSEPVPYARAMYLAFLAAGHAQLGNAEAAARAKAELAKVSPFFDREILLGQLRAEADRARLREGLAKAGIGD